jgi:hypothetical protein
MTVTRMGNMGIVLESLDVAISFFTELKSPSVILDRGFGGRWKYAGRPRGLGNANPPSQRSPAREGTANGSR